MTEFEIRPPGPAPAALWLVPFLAGVACILFGVLIAILPELLVAMVASAFVLLGLALASLGWRLRRSAALLVRGRGLF